MLLKCSCYSANSVCYLLFYVLSMQIILPVVPFNIDSCRRKLAMLYDQFKLKYGLNSLNGLAFHFDPLLVERNEIKFI